MIILYGYFDIQDSPEFEKEFGHLRLEHNNNWFDTMELESSEWDVKELVKGNPEQIFIYRITKKS